MWKNVQNRWFLKKIPNFCSIFRVSERFWIKIQEVVMSEHPKKTKILLLRWSVVRKICKKLEKNNKKHDFFVSFFCSIALNELCTEVAEKSVFFVFFRKRHLNFYILSCKKTSFFCKKYRLEPAIPSETVFHFFVKPTYPYWAVVWNQ